MNSNSDMRIYIDRYSSPPNDSWFKVRSIDEWTNIVLSFGMPIEILFGPNQGINNDLALNIIYSIILFDKTSEYTFIPDNFTFNSDTIGKPYLYKKLTEYLENRKLYKLFK